MAARRKKNAKQAPANKEPPRSLMARLAALAEEQQAADARRSERGS